MWTFLGALLGVVLVVTVLLDAFETILLPRTITQGFRLTRFFYRVTWQPWAALARRLPPGTLREHSLSFFGPLSILLLTGCWAASLVVGFGLLQWAFTPRHYDGEIGTSVYLSGNVFFTLGLGDVSPYTRATRVLAVMEAGLGFAFLACIIGYLPVLYAGFSRRELFVLRLDVRAGSPPSAGELLRQHGHRGDDARDLDELLRDAEKWAAELLESQLSYPILCMYRSQHRDQSWLATLTTLLDACALLIVGVRGIESKQAPMTFAMARRAMLDLAHVFSRASHARAVYPDRLPPEELGRLRALLERDATLKPGGNSDDKLTRLRATYEPSAHALSEFLLMPLPPWMPPPEAADRPTSAAEMFFEEQGATDVSMI